LPDDHNYEGDAWQTRFDGYRRVTLDDLAGLGLAVYDHGQAAWIVPGGSGPFPGQGRRVPRPADRDDPTHNTRAARPATGHPHRRRPGQADRHARQAAANNHNPAEKTWTTPTATLTTG
jgi:hypothetical protein